MNNFVGFASAALQIGLESVLIKPVRGLYGIQLPDGSLLADIVAQATIEERHSDQLEITEHPVEQGASIADHAFKRPAEVVLQLGWSNSPSGNGSLLDFAVGAAAAVSPAARQIANVAGTAAGVVSTVQSVLSGSDPSQINAIYQQLLHLQESRALFVIYTGKRVYTNMVCKTITTETNNKTANSLIVTLTCHQVILVSTQTVTLPAANQKDASATASPVDKGTKSVKIVGELGK